MRSFEIFVAPEPSPPSDGAEWRPTGPPGVSPAPRSGRRVNEVLDLFIHGANVTARVAERHASCVLRDLAWALSDLVRVPRGKRIVRFYEDAWELCVERLGVAATLSVYRGGAEPTVLVYDRAVVFEEMCASVVEALDATLARRGAGAAQPHDLVEARRVLDTARGDAIDVTEEAPASSPVSVDLDRDAPISFRCIARIHAHGDGGFEFLVADVVDVNAGGLFEGRHGFVHLDAVGIVAFKGSVHGDGRSGVRSLDGLFKRAPGHDGERNHRCRRSLRGSRGGLGRRGRRFGRRGGRTAGTQDHGSHDRQACQCPQKGSLVHLSFLLIRLRSDSG